MKKICSTCGIDKSIEEYSPNRGQCKECRRSCQQKWESINSNKITLQRRKNYTKRKDDILKYQKKWKEEHKENIKEYKKQPGGKKK